MTFADTETESTAPRSTRANPRGANRERWKNRSSRFTRTTQRGNRTRRGERCSPDSRSSETRTRRRRVRRRTRRRRRRRARRPDRRRRRASSPRPAPRVCFSTTPFAANAVAFAEGDVARDASVGAARPVSSATDALRRAPTPSAFAVSAEDDPAARADERCVAESQVLLQRYYESTVGAGVETRRRDGDDGIVNVDSKNSRVVSAPKSRPRRAGRFGRRERAARFPRGDRAGGRALEWRRRCPLRCRRVRCRRVPRRFRIRRIVATRSGRLAGAGV